MPHSRSLSSLLACALLPALAPAQIKDIGPSGPIVRIETGLRFTEGPAQDIAGNLYFSDVQGNTIYKIDANGQRSTFLTQSSNANGIYFDRKDRMLVCQHAGRVVEVDTTTKAVTVLAGTYNSVAFNSPNDLVPDVWGGVYFTDPTFGGNRQDKEAVYYRAANGTVTRLIDALLRPNGVVLSPKEDTLYVASQNPSAVMSYPVLGPGRLGPGTQWFALGGSSVDGMTVDSSGNIYMARPGFSAIEVVTPAGTSLGRITFPESPSNCAFGGQAMKTLFVTARTSVYSAPMLATGHRPLRLTASGTTLSSTGGRVTFGIEATPIQAGRLYVMLTSNTGATQGLPVNGTWVPIDLDATTPLWLSVANTPIFPGFIGVLDSRGAAAPRFELPTFSSSFIGLNFDFAALLWADSSSNAARVQLIQ